MPGVQLVQSLLPLLLLLASSSGQAPPPQGFAGQRGAQVPLSHGAMCIGSRVRRERAPGVSLAAAEPGALGSSGGGGPMGGPRAMDLRGVCK